MNKSRRQWENITRIWGSEGAIEGVDLIKLEAEIIECAFSGFCTYGNLHESNFYNDQIDALIAENVLYNLGIPDRYIEDTDIPGHEDGTYLTYWISEIVWNLRRVFLKMYGNVRIVEHEGNLMHAELNVARVIDCTDDCWYLHTEFKYHDSGYLAAPTLSEFKTLMYHWQELHGNNVGQTKNSTAPYTLYIGRNRELFEYNGPKGTRNTEVPMGNPYSSKSQRRYSIVTENGPVEVLVNDKLSACYAFYLNKVDRLIQYGLNEGDDHWMHLLELLDSDLICHCGDFTNRRDSSKFCHGLVLLALADWLSPFSEC